MAVKDPDAISDISNGVVVLIDALGISTSTVQGSKRFIEIRNDIVSNLKRRKNVVAQKLNIQSKGKVITFGDTIILLWESSDEELCNVLIAASSVIASIIVQSLYKGILWRGAIATGEYISHSSSSTILGPAISDAAAWYNAADWFGVIATPRTGYYIERNIEKFIQGYKVNTPVELTCDYYKQYSVPLKNNASLNLWALTWPCFHGTDNADTPYKEFLNNISKLQIPPGTESKYANSTNFFKWCECNCQFAANSIAKDIFK